MKNRGFTLIELLVVVAIIGLLASVVISSLSSARDKAKVASIKSTIRNLQKEGEIWYLTNGNYIPSGTAGSPANCPTSIDANWGFLGSEKGVSMINSLLSNSGNVGSVCAINPESWAITVGTTGLSKIHPLVNTAHAAEQGFICVDSSLNVILDLSGGSDGSFRGNRISNSSGIWRCSGF